LVSIQNSGRVTGKNEINKNKVCSKKTKIEIPMAFIPGQYQTQQLPSIRDVFGEFFTPEYRFLLNHQSNYRVPKLKIPRSKVSKNVVQNFKRKYTCKWDSKDNQKCMEEFASASTHSITLLATTP
jgi:hypothetical protein